MIEFAIVVGVLILIVVGVVYFGRILNYTVDDTHIANIAARYAAVDQNPACTNGDPTGSCTMSLAQWAKSQAYGGELQNGGGSGDISAAVAPGGGIKVCISLPPGSAGNQGDPVQVTVSSTFQVLPFSALPIPVNETATMRLENIPATQLFGCSS